MLEYIEKTNNLFAKEIKLIAILIMSRYLCNFNLMLNEFDNIDSICKSFRISRAIFSYPAINICRLFCFNSSSVFLCVCFSPTNEWKILLIRLLFSNSRFHYRSCVVNKIKWKLYCYKCNSNISVFFSLHYLNQKLNTPFKLLKY